MSNITANHCPDVVQLPPDVHALEDWGTGPFGATPQYRPVRSFNGQTRCGAVDGCHQPIEVCMFGEQADDGEIDAAISVDSGIDAGLLIDARAARALAADLLAAADDIDAWASRE